MDGAKINKLVAAGIAAANSIVPVLVLTGAVSLTSDGVAAVYLAVSNVLTFVGLIFAQSEATNT